MNKSTLPTVKLAIVAIVMGAVALTGCAQQHTSTIAVEPAIAKTTARATVTPVTFAAAGDSITAWIDRNNIPVHTTWVTSSPNRFIQFTGQGWAKGGAKLAEIDANITPVTADVLVIMAGTNDEGDRWGTPMATRLAEVVDIAVKSHAPHVLLSAVAPRDAGPAWAADWNVQLAHLATVEGWSFVDPWGFLRTADGHYMAGTTVEGIHPTPASQVVVGQELRAAIVAANGK